MTDTSPPLLSAASLALSIRMQAPEALKPHPKNSRKHPKSQIRKIARSIQELGFLRAVMVDRYNFILAGHASVEAAKSLGLSEIPTILVDGLSEQQIRAYIIADNKLAELSSWDAEILCLELEDFISFDPDFDVTLTGFEVPEIDLILAGAKAPEHEPDDLIEESSGPAISQAGDLWLLGPHRLLCGSALDTSTFVSLMGKKRAAVCFADPPYNVPIDGHATGNGSIRHRDFAMATGEMSPEAFSVFLTTAMRLFSLYSRPNSIHYICMDWRHAGEVLAAGNSTYDTLLNVCVWVKDNGGMGSFYRSQHELVFVFRNAGTPNRNNIQLGRFGRNRTNVWKYPCINTQSKQSDEGNLLALHPTVKPIAMVADALLDCSARGEIVLDPFLGSGTTLMAAQRVGRICHGIEIDPLYVDTAVRRWQRHTGELATHASSGQTFNERAAAVGEVQHV